jgi:hypothetical protein
LDQVPVADEHLVFARRRNALVFRVQHQTRLIERSESVRARLRQERASRAVHDRTLDDGAEGNVGPRSERQANGGIQEPLALMDVEE